MENQHTKQTSGFARFAWGVLAWNILVILWGVFLRASRSGDGCGQHWLTCGGEVIPSAPELKTVIEFSHRVTTTVAGLLIIALAVWAFRRWQTAKTSENRRIMWMSVASLIFVVIEGMIGAGLVLTGNTAETLTAARPFWMAGHLINTFILLAFLTLTAYFASNGERFIGGLNKRFLGGVVIGAFGIIVIGITGSIAALAAMLFPAGTLTEGLVQDFSPTSHMLLRLRLLHPITAILGSVIVIFLVGGLAKKQQNNQKATRWSNIISLLILVQIGFGAATLLTLSPIVMQLGHLLLADCVWISYVLFSVNLVYGRETETPV